MKFYKLISLIFLIHFSYSQNGILKGKVFDANTGEGLIGANVMIAGTSHGAATDLDGSYSIKLPIGVYTVNISYIAYQSKTINNVEVIADVKILNISIEEEALSSDEVVVEAKLFDNNESGLLISQKNSTKVFDAVSSEQLSKTSDGNVASAIKRVTGVTIVGGKNVYVRGLGNRYSNLQVNGSDMPSTNPDKKEFPVEAFSSQLLDNIVVQKTYTADQPGEFSGGSVQIKTKDFPGSRFMSLGFGVGYNSYSTFNDMLSYKGGSYDFLGYDDGHRELPSIVKANNYDRKEAYSKFNSNYTGNKSTALPSQSYSFAYADEFLIKVNSLGIVSSLSYDNSHSLINSQYAQVVSPEFNNYEYDLEKGKFTTNMSSMLNLFYKVKPNFILGLKNLYINSSSDEANTIEGLDYNAGGNTPLLYKQTQLKFVQSQVFTSSLVSELYLPEFFQAKWQTSLSYSYANRYEPDTRRSITRYFDDAQKWGIVTGRDMGNSHFFSEQDDNNYNVKSNIEIKSSSRLKIKTGFNFLFKNRYFWARRFNIKHNTITRDANADIFYSDVNDALSAENINNDLFQFQDLTSRSDNYKADRTTTAFFISSDYNFSKKLNFILGARAEYDITNLNFDKAVNGVSTINQNSFDILPALNTVYRLNEKSNIRFAISKTLVRPQFREVAPFFYSDFIGSKVLNGNPELKKTDIANLDLRYEHFFNTGELFAVSTFAKSFKNPIERIYRQTENNELFYVNADKAELFGIEFELRKSLTSRLKISSNVTMITSKVSYSKQLGENGPDTDKIQANTDRPLIGQSPYTINISSFYDIPEMNLNLALSYNRFGKRINAVGSYLQTDDEFEMPFNQLDLTMAYKHDIYKFKLNIKNILNEDVVFKQVNTIVDKYSPGITYKMSTSIDL